MQLLIYIYIYIYIYIKLLKGICLGHFLLADRKIAFVEIQDLQKRVKADPRLTTSYHLV